MNKLLLVPHRKNREALQKCTILNWGERCLPDAITGLFGEPENLGEKSVP